MSYVSHDSNHVRHLYENDEWKATWDWAKSLWNGDERGYYRFFRGVASEYAQRTGMEELGSSDVWHICYDSVRAGRASGMTQQELMNFVENRVGERG